MVRSSIDVSESGPFFDGGTAKAIGAFEDQAEKDVADVAAQMIQEELGHVLKHPTGRYRRSIHTVTHGANTVVTDGGIVYGPWLEGVGSRNARSRFKGYSTFRRIGQKVAAKSGAIAEATLSHFTGRM